MSYCSFNSERRFLLGVLFEINIFCLTDNTLSETVCLFCFCVLFSAMYPEIKFTAKNWSDLCNFYSKVIFFYSCLIYLFFVELELLMFHNYTVKNSEKLNVELVETLPPSYLTYPTDFCIICIHFYCGKK